MKNFAFILLVFLSPIVLNSQDFSFMKPKDIKATPTITKLRYCSFINYLATQQYADLNSNQCSNQSRR